jgi:hypothetical protein
MGLCVQEFKEQLQEFFNPNYIFKICSSLRFF